MFIPEVQEKLAKRFVSSRDACRVCLSRTGRTHGTVCCLVFLRN